MSGKIKNLLKLTLSLAQVICLIMFIPACGKKEEKKEIKGKEEKKEFKVVEPSYDTSIQGEEGIRNTIKAYNEVLANVHLSDPYFKVLRKYASDKEVKRMFVEDRYNTERGLAMRSWLQDLIFEKISVSEKSAVVDTNEVWDFDYIDIKTKEIREPKSRVRYKLRYLLEKEEGRWIVSSIKERQTRVFEPVK